MKSVEVMPVVDDGKDQSNPKKKGDMYVKEGFNPHKMYDPKTGKSYDAKTEKDHLRMKKMGYTHK